MKAFIKKLFIFTGIVLLVIPFEGCNNYLEQLPDQRTELNSPEKVAELVTSAYPRANYITFLEAMSDNAEDKALITSDLLNSDPWFFKDVQKRDEDSPDFYWHETYAAIAAANLALESIENAADPTSYQPTKGEALVARAYAHFMLVTLYSKVYNPLSADTDPGIPYVTVPEKIVVQKYERKTVAYVYEQIEKDLTEGLPLIRNSSYEKGAPSYHFTTSAAHAFAARFYLFKKDYKKVLEHANQVFAGGGILPNLRPINSVAYRSLEPLLKQAEYTKDTQAANLLLVEAPTVWGRNMRSYRYGFGVRLLNEMVFGDNVTTGRWGYAFYGNETSYFTPKFREHFVKDDPNANFGTPYNMIPLFSAEEVLFNRAEANTMLGDYEAVLKDLNDFASTRIIENDTDQPYYNASLHSITEKKLRDFYNTPDLEVALIAAILDFKKIEFLFEGHRWFDIIRHQIPVVHTTADHKTTITIGANDPRRVLQIPQEVQSAGIELNPR